jgi:hypothetical protein
LNRSIASPGAVYGIVNRIVGGNFSFPAQPRKTAGHGEGGSRAGTEAGGGMRSMSFGVRGQNPPACKNGMDAPAGRRMFPMHEFCAAKLRIPGTAGCRTKTQGVLVGWAAQGIGAEFPAPGGGGELERIARSPPQAGMRPTYFGMRLAIAFLTGDCRLLRSACGRAARLCPKID